MNTIEDTSTQPRLIAVRRLETSPLNARRTAPKVGMAELKASLLAHGLMQNLVVTEQADGAFRVIAGGRRLEALRSLQAEGKLPEDFTVPCHVVTDENALEMSLAENTVRLAMHPADEFEAFAALIEKGESAADVARRFGVDESHVLKRLKLARVAPHLLKRYRNGDLTLECLKAFTITDDHRRQVKVFKSLQEWQKDDPSAIRAALTGKLIEAGDNLARFVGIDAYVAAGGSTRSDLFGEEVYLEKPALLHRLADEKLTGIRTGLEAEGWGWIEVHPDRNWEFVHRCGRIKPQLVGAPAELIEFKARLDAELGQIEQALGEAASDDLRERQRLTRERLDEVEERLAAFVGFDAEHKTLAGCYVSVGQDGTPSFDKGLVKPEHRKLLARLLNADASEGAPDPAKPKNPMPESLRRDLAAYRLQVAQVEIAKQPAIALDLLVFQIASELLGDDPVSEGPAVAFRPSRAQPGAEVEPTAAASALAAIEESLPVKWLKPKSEAARFEAFRSLPHEDKLHLLAYCVALTLPPKLGPADGEAATAYDLALALTGASVADYWRPTGDTFFSRRTREQLLAIMREVLGDGWAASSGSEKKSVLADRLHRAFADAADPDRTPEQAEKLKTWLPAGMAFGPAPAAKPAKSRKGRTAA